MERGRGALLLLLLRGAAAYVLDGYQRPHAGNSLHNMKLVNERAVDSYFRVLPPLAQQPPPAEHGPDRHRDGEKTTAGGQITVIKDEELVRPSRKEYFRKQSVYEKNTVVGSKRNSRRPHRAQSFHQKMYLSQARDTSQHGVFSHGDRHVQPARPLTVFDKNTYSAKEYRKRNTLDKETMSHARMLDERNDKRAMPHARMLGEQDDKNDKYAMPNDRMLEGRNDKHAMPHARMLDERNDKHAMSHARMLDERTDKHAMPHARMLDDRNDKHAMSHARMLDERTDKHAMPHARMLDDRNDKHAMPHARMLDEPNEKHAVPYARMLDERINNLNPLKYVREGTDAVGRAPGRVGLFYRSSREEPVDARAALEEAADGAYYRGSASSYVDLNIGRKPTPVVL